MRYYLYFPQPKSASAEALLRSAGFDALCVAPYPNVYDVVDGGPDGKSGRILWWSDPRFAWNGLHMDRTTWQRLPVPLATPETFPYVGWENRWPVEPADIQRPETVAGQWVTLEDGREWLVPIATSLPRVFGFNEKGEFATIRRKSHADYFEYTYNVVLRQWLSGETQPDVETVAQYAAQTLAINYYLTDKIAVGLGLLGEASCVRICKAACDLEAIVEAHAAEKKTAG